VCLVSFAFAEIPSPAQIERQQEMIEKERALRQRIEEDGQVFVRQIVVTGVTLLDEEEVKKIIQPYEGRRLSKKNIQAILDDFALAYKEKGCLDRLARTSYHLRQGYLEITIKEKK
jgi:hemolysin activation/secretion protein